MTKYPGSDIDYKRITHVIKQIKYNNWNIVFRDTLYKLYIINNKKNNTRLCYVRLIYQWILEINVLILSNSHYVSMFNKNIQ